MSSWRQIAPALALLAVACDAPAPAPPIDPAAGQMLAPIRREALRPEELVARLQLAPDAVVADIGAGPGFLTLPLARAVPTGRVIATDLRADHLAIAARRARDAGLLNVETRVVARDRPELPPASIDLALLCQVDQYLPDRVAYLRALTLALRPGGRIALVNYVSFRSADRAAAEALSLHVVDEWSPSPPFFLMVLKP